MAAIKIREFKTQAEWNAAMKLLKQLNPDMPLREIAARVAHLRAGSYRCVGAYDGKKLAGLCGFWVGWRIWCGKYIDIDNFVVDAKWRGKGVGGALVEWVEKEGRRLGCHLAVLDSYATSAEAHRFYFGKGYHIEGYHMIKPLGDPKVSRVNRRQ